MTDRDTGASHEQAAGEFSSWISEMRDALRGERGIDVPCGRCTACCTSSQFVHIGPDETDTLSRIPAALLFPAPGRPSGHLLMGYDERGHCPMLVDGQCTIYDHRPRTCRVYDCRVFAAAGVALDDDDDGGDKVEIARQVRRWRFTYRSREDHDQHEAVRAAASFLAEHTDLLPHPAGAPSAAQVAIRAVEIHDAFLQRDAETGQARVATPDVETVRMALLTRLRSDGDDRAKDLPA